MSFVPQIGESVSVVSDPTFGNGFISDVRPGPLYLVKARGQHARLFEASELRAGPPTPAFPRGTRIMLHGSVGTVIARDADGCCVVEVESKMRGFRYPTRFHLPPWQVAIAEPASEAA